MLVDIFNLEDKFCKINEYWSPKIVAELNEQYVKLAKIKGEFDWHHHENEDELFFVVKGAMEIDLEDETLQLTVGECAVIPKGVSHRPRAESECWIMLFEPKTTLNTGNLVNEKTHSNLDRI